MQSCAVLCKNYPKLGTPTQAALSYGQFSKEFVESLTGDEIQILDYLTLGEFNRRQIEAMDDEKAKQEDAAKFPGIASRLPNDEIQARLDERKRMMQGEV